MAARAVPVVRVDYPKLWFVVGAAVLAAATAYAAWSASDSIEDFGMAFWTGAAAVTGTLMAAFFLPPLFTSHRLGAKGIRVRMGLLIDVTIPYEWVSEVRTTTVKRGAMSFGLGVRYSGITATAFVLSNFTDLIALRLDTEHQLGGFLRPKVSQVVLSVKDPEGTMRVIRERSGSGPTEE
jgi:hypothetical protein